MKPVIDVKRGLSHKMCGLVDYLSHFMKISDIGEID